MEFIKNFPFIRIVVQKDKICVIINKKTANKLNINEILLLLQSQIALLQFCKASVKTPDIKIAIIPDTNVFTYSKNKIYLKT